uniref:Kinesin motor domain-containing protein n=1 Tax=Monopterus albus TaxID=43700 RepID=A0A3Q3JEY8_MONAL
MMESYLDNKADKREQADVDDLKRDLPSQFSTLSDSQEKEHLHVYLRIRPFTSTESHNGESQDCVTIEAPDTVLLKSPRLSVDRSLPQTGQRFQFSQVYGPETTQRELFEGTVKELVKDVLVGGHSLVFTYGVTNAGKTFTFLGPETDAGILPRSLDVIFSSIDERVFTGMSIKPHRCQEFLRLTREQQAEEAAFKRNLFRQLKEVICLILLHINSFEMEEDTIRLDVEMHTKFSVWVSFCEIYNESIHDLLEVAPSGAQRRPVLRLSQDVKGNTFVKDLCWVQVNSAEEAYKVMKLGKRNQSFSSTRLNQLSSRSHSIFSIRILRIEDVGIPRVHSVSELLLCDLAGSERYTKTQNQGERLKEAGNINTSLHLSVTSLRLLQHVPFRESKLTHYLQGFFCGRGRACMIVNINQCASVYDETLNVLRFSAVAQKVVVLSTRPLPTMVQRPATEESSISNAERKSLQGSKRSSQVVWETSLEDVQVGWRSLNSKVPGLNYHLVNCHCVVNTSFVQEDENGDQVTLLKQLQLQLKEERAESLLMEARVREEVSREFSELFSQMQSDYNERLAREREILEERADRRLEIFKNLTDKMAKAEPSQDTQAMVTQSFFNHTHCVNWFELISSPVTQEALAALEQEKKAREDGLVALEYQTMGKEEERKAKEEALATLEELKRNKDKVLASLEEERKGRGEAMAALEAERRAKEDALTSLAEVKRSTEEALAVFGDDRSGEEIQSVLELERKEISRLVEEKEKMQQEVDALQQEVRELTIKLEAAEHQKETSDRLLDDLKQKSTEQEQILELLKAELEEARIKGLATSSSSAAEDLKSLSSDLQTEVAPLREKVSSMEEPKESSCQTEAQLASVEMERMLKERDGQVQEKLAELERESAQREAELQKKFLEKEALVTSLQKSLQKVQERQEEEECRAVQEARRREVERRRELLAVAHEAIAQKDAELEKKAEEISRLQENARQDADKIKSLSFDLQRKEDDLSDLREKLADYKKQIQQVQKEISTMREEEKALRQKLTDTEKAKKQLQSDLANRDRTILQLRAERVMEDMRLALTEQEETQEQMEQVLEEKLDLIQELSSGKLCTEKHQAERRKWLEEKLSLIGQAKEAENKRNQEMRKFAEDRERYTRQQSQLESLSSQLAEKEQTMAKWRKERDTLVAALEVQLQKLLSSQAEKDKLIQQLHQSNTQLPLELQAALCEREAEILRLKEELEALTAKQGNTVTQVSHKGGSASCPSVLDSSEISTEKQLPLQPNPVVVQQQSKESASTFRITRSASKKKNREMEKVRTHQTIVCPHIHHLDMKVEAENRRNTRTKVTPKLTPHQEETSGPAGRHDSQSSIRSRKEGTLQKIGDFLQSSPTLLGTKAKKVMSLVSGRGDADSAASSSSFSLRAKKNKRKLYRPEISSPMDMPSHPIISREPEEKERDQQILKRRLRSRIIK